MHDAIHKQPAAPFNSALETGVRALAILAAAYPNGHDLHRLVQYDYLTVHSADADGPPSLHPALPLRSNELLVRRHLVERGLLLMMSAGLIARYIDANGFQYAAEDAAGAFLANLKSEYLAGVKERANWVIETFDSMTNEELVGVTKKLFAAWTVEFLPIESDQQLEQPT
ncbi:MAG: threonine transporter [Parvibaculum sp.]